ncbi:hypothetical protein L598_003900000070 [Mesorhizobium sp. J18]|uniref:hypothetical protein n=1 Tax=Mesorhizobium sp. J18 TaxID=935263 RepID=UPI00119AF653|nr:hypothetical protein [Mesorhizobium sp. J18]TWG94098.1 hypothetical protein L598_003900000070 [Mesorhizobium sp. J18]
MNIYVSDNPASVFEVGQLVQHTDKEGLEGFVVSAGGGRVHVSTVYDDEGILSYTVTADRLAPWEGCAVARYKRDAWMAAA